MNFPAVYNAIEHATQSAGFTMASDALTGSLLRTLSASKPASSLLEMGTGTGLSASWILDGMDQQSTLVSIDNDAKMQDIAKRFLSDDRRLQLVLGDGGEWLSGNCDRRFDYIFADTWHGKYLMLDETLAMLNAGGLYIIDDLLPQSNWPEGHDEKVRGLIHTLEQRKDFSLTWLDWSNGIISVLHSLQELRQRSGSAVRSQPLRSAV